MVYDGVLFLGAVSGVSLLSQEEDQANQRCSKKTDCLSDLMDRNMTLQMQLDQERKQKEVEIRKLQLVTQAREESMQRQMEEFQQSLEALQARFEYDLHFDILNEMPREKAVRLCNFVEYLEKERCTIRDRSAQMAAESEKLCSTAENGKLRTKPTTRCNVKVDTQYVDDLPSPLRTSTTVAQPLVHPLKLDMMEEEVNVNVRMMEEEVPVSECATTADEEVDEFQLNTARGEPPKQTDTNADENDLKGPVIEDLYSCKAGDTQMYGCNVTLSDSSGASVTHPLFRLSITPDRWPTLRVTAQDMEAQLEDVEGFTWAITEALDGTQLSQFGAIYDLRLLSVPSYSIVLAIASWCRENEHRFTRRLQAAAVILPDSYWMSALHGCVWMVTYIAPPVCPFQIVYSLEDAEAFLEDSFQNAKAPDGQAEEHYYAAVYAEQ